MSRAYNACIGEFNMTASLVEMQGITKVYPGGKVANSNVNFDLRQCDTHAYSVFRYVGNAKPPALPWVSSFEGGPIDPNGPGRKRAQARYYFNQFGLAIALYPHEAEDLP
jgi:hypothetical protein